MRTIKSILSGDAIDAHGERLSLDSLKTARDQTNQKILSSHKEHDFRNPPIARIKKAHIENDHGVNILVGEIEYFELQDINKENPIKRRELATYELEEGTFNVLYDRSYELNGFVDDVIDLTHTIDPEINPNFEIKKTVEPVSTLIFFAGLGISFAAKGFLEGFFNKAGEEFWNLLVKLANKNIKHDPEKEYIYQFVFDFRNEYYKVEVIIIFSNPVPEHIKDILDKNQHVIESVVNIYYKDAIRVGRIVFTSDGANITHEYSVYRDGTPFDIRNIENYTKLLNSQ